MYFCTLVNYTIEIKIDETSITTSKNEKENHVQINLDYNSFLWDMSTVFILERFKKKKKIIHQAVYIRAGGI